MESFGQNMENWYFDPLTGTITTKPLNYDRVSDRMVTSKMSGGIFGGAVKRPELFEARDQGYTSDKFVEAVTGPHGGKNGSAKLRQYYTIQSLQSLGERNNQASVPIWIARNGRSDETLSVAWIEHIQRAIDDINYAAPGLCLYITSEESKAKIKIFGETTNKCYTIGNVLSFPRDPVTIYLHWKWMEMKRTSCHELLHALGFGHEHQRRDRDSSVDVDSMHSQYCKKEHLLGITCFDPFSIMMYPESETLSRNSGDPVWFTKPHKELNREMSELDKVGLNNLYHPCKGPNYSPTRFGRGITGLWYCGRYFGVQTSDHDGYCGPTNGPNCPACRVLRSDRVVSLWKKGKWQGWTGEVYCGRYFGVKEQGHDGYCGPNNGPSCPECDIELLSGCKVYGYKHCLS